MFKNYLSFFIIVFVASLTLMIFPQKAVALGFGQSLAICPGTCNGPPPSDYCSISAPGECNVCTSGSDNSCCLGGSAWSKYIASCRMNVDLECDWYWVYDTYICSTGDKCVGSETGLRSGSCTCGSFSSSVYKYCCTTSGEAESCIQGYPDDGVYPIEGTCPGGDIVDGSRVRSSACTPVATPSPIPDFCTPGMDGPVCTTTWCPPEVGGTACAQGNYLCLPDGSGYDTTTCSNVTDDCANCPTISPTPPSTSPISSPTPTTPTPTRTPTPTPTRTPTPTPVPPTPTTAPGWSPTPSITYPSCLSTPITLSSPSQLKISWRNSTTPVTWVDISEGNNFLSYFHKGSIATGNPTGFVSNPGLSVETPAPAGFGAFINATDPLIIMPNQVYQVRTFTVETDPNGGHSVAVAFSIPLCPTPTPGGGGGGGGGGATATPTPIPTPISGVLVPPNVTPRCLYPGLNLTWTNVGGDVKQYRINVSFPGLSPIVNQYKWAAVGGSNSYNYFQVASAEYGDFSWSVDGCDELASPNCTAPISRTTTCSPGALPTPGGEPVNSPTNDTPWIQVFGDVHSNTGINAPGGPN